MKSHMVEHSDTGLLIVCFFRVTIHKNPVRQNQIQQYVCGTFLVALCLQWPEKSRKPQHVLFSFEAAVLKRKKEDLFALDVGDLGLCFTFQRKKINP